MDDEIPENILNKIEEIRLNNISGSIELAKKSIETIIDLLNQNSSHNQIIKTSILLANAQPNMASIFNLVNNLMFIVDRNKNKKLSDIVNDYCNKYIKDLNNADKKIGELATKHLKNNATIITHSYSSTILNTLLYAKRSGKKFSVICTESRPKNEGVKLAKILGKNNIKVKLLVDTAVFSLIPYADMILVGGDAVTDAGLINKIGTKGIIMTAQHYYTPTYALCSTIKFLPKKYPITLDNLKDPNEIYSKKLQNVTPVNYYFDYTPLEYITGIITEKEILDPAKVRKKIKNLKIHRSLI
jgi:translation initiation factor 2B subunit (eIF-2B alpha/beta/delta family)